MRRILLTILFFSSILSGFAQTYDERIALAMNKNDWFSLDSIYKGTPKDSITPFLEVFSRCLIGNRLNRPEESVQAFDELFRNHSTELNLGNMLSSAMMFSMDLNRLDENKRAADMLTAILSSTKEYLDSTWVTALRNNIDYYNALAGYTPYEISFENQRRGKVPFRIVHVGPENKNSVLMHLENSSINGVDADITFDTGAGVNVISNALANKYNLVPLDASAKVAGHGLQTGYRAIAKELKIGDMTLKDVPFSVMDITSGNAEADKYIDQLMIVVGSEMMLRLKDLTIDFVNNEITVPCSAPQRSQIVPNMCFSSGMNLLAKGIIHDNPMLMCIDSGDASYGSLNKKFFDRNREYVMSHGEPDSIRSAGIGGVHISQCYRVPDMELRLGGCRTMIPEMVVSLSENPSSNILDYECNIGLMSLMRFKRIRFNMVDFVLTTYQDAD